MASTVSMQPIDYLIEDVPQRTNRGILVLRKYLINV